MLVFIAGPPRAGTTLLQQVICNSMGTDLLPECVAITELLRYRREFLGDEDESRRTYGRTGTEVDAAIKGLAAAVLGRRLTHQSVVLKSPYLSYYLNDLGSLLEHPSKTLCIVRNPKDAISSLMQVRARQGRARDVVEAAEFLGGFYDALMRQMNEASGDPAHLVRYEDLVSREPLTLNSLGAFIGEDLDLGPLNEPRDEALNANNPWHTDLYGRAATVNRISAYRAYLTDEEICAIDQSYERFYDQFGYRPHGEEDPGERQAA